MQFLFSVLVAPVVVLLTATQTLAAIQTKVVGYKHGNAVLEGLLAYDDAIQENALVY